MFQGLYVISILEHARELGEQCKCWGTLGNIPYVIGQFDYN